MGARRGSGFVLIHEFLRAGSHLDTNPFFRDSTIRAADADPVTDSELIPLKAKVGKQPSGEEIELVGSRIDECTIGSRR